MSSQAQSGTFITRFTVTDEDIGQSHVFRLTGGDIDLFVLEDDGQLFKKTEEVLNLNQIHNVEVAAVDDGSPPKEVRQRIVHEMFTF